MAIGLAVAAAAFTQSARWRRDVFLDQARQTRWCSGWKVEDSSSPADAGLLMLFDDTVDSANLALAAAGQGVPIAMVGSGHRTQPGSVTRMVQACAGLHFPYDRRAARNLARTGAPRRDITVTADPLTEYASRLSGDTEGTVDLAIMLDPKRSSPAEIDRLRTALGMLEARGAIVSATWLDSEKATDLPITLSTLNRARVVISDQDWVLDLTPVFGWRTVLVRPEPDRPQLIAQYGSRLSGFDADRLTVDIMTALMQRDRPRPEFATGNTGTLQPLMKRLEAIAWDRRFTRQSARHPLPAGRAHATAGAS